MLKSIYFSFVFILFLLFGFLPFLAFANVCLHPLEMAALLHGKPKSESLEDKFKQADKDVEELMEKQTKLEGLIDDELAELSINALKDDIFKKDGQPLTGTKLTAAKLSAGDAVYDYMEGKGKLLGSGEIQRRKHPLEYRRPRSDYLF